MALLTALLAAWIAGCGAVVAVGTAIRVADRAQPLRLSRQGFAVWARETAAHALFTLMIPSGWLPFSPQGRGARRPVVLVPGYLMNRSCWTFFTVYLRNRGFGWLHAINNRPFNAPIDQFAQNLDREVDALRLASGAERVDVVGHSMGGVIAAHWILHYGGADKVNRLVTLGSPLSGTKMATYATLREGRDLFPDSAVIQGLGPLPCPATHLWSEHDHLVIPTENAVPIWAGETLRLPWMGHLEMLMNLRAFRAVLEALDPQGRVIDGAEE